MVGSPPPTEPRSSVARSRSSSHDHLPQAFTAPGSPMSTPPRTLGTLTPNPSLDRTVSLTGPLERGAVLRADSVTSQAGGKGVNISRAAVAAGVRTIAVLPAGKDDPFVVELLRDGIDC